MFDSLEGTFRPIKVKYIKKIDLSVALWKQRAYNIYKSKKVDVKEVNP